MELIIIYITYPDLETARKIVTSLLEKRLIACGNIFPINSVYWWNGQIDNSDEMVSIIKTTRKNWEKVRSEVTALHPYEIPCIIKLGIEANDEYGSWIKSEVQQ